MSFPVVVPLSPFGIDAHLLFDAIAYFTGFQLYLRARRRTGDALDAHARWWIVAAAIAGAAIGSKVLFWFEDPAETLAHRHDLAFLIGGKTVVGGLVGGWIAVELTKKGARHHAPHRRSLRGAAGHRDGDRPHRLGPDSRRCESRRSCSRRVASMFSMVNALWQCDTARFRRTSCALVLVS